MFLKLLGVMGVKPADYLISLIHQAGTEELKPSRIVAIQTIDIYSVLVFLSQGILLARSKINYIIAGQDPPEGVSPHSP